MPGPPSDNTQVSAFVDAMEREQGFDSAAGLGASSTIGAYAARMIADQQYTRVAAEDLRESLTASVNALAMTRSSISGVNVDTELQQLIQIEQSYAANSQMMRVLSEMLDTLLAAV